MSELAQQSQAVQVEDAGWGLDDSSIPSLRFPQKLWRIVNECRSGAIGWGSAGQTVRLHYSRFQAEYLAGDASVFKTSNIASFIRQLNLYGFRKLAAGGSARDCPAAPGQQDVHEFAHEHFREGRLDLLYRVCRKTGAKRAAAAARSDLRRKPGDDDALGLSLVAEDQPTTLGIVKEELGSNEDGHSRLRICRLALTQALEQATLQYKREKLWLQFSNRNVLSETLQPKYETATLDENVEIIFHDMSSDSDGNLQIVENSLIDNVVDNQEKNQWQVLSLSNDGTISISVPY